MAHVLATFGQFDGWSGSARRRRWRPRRQPASGSGDWTKRACRPRKAVVCRDGPARVAPDDV